MKLWRAIVERLKPSRVLRSDEVEEMQAAAMEKALTTRKVKRTASANLEPIYTLGRFEPVEIVTTHVVTEEVEVVDDE